MHDRVDMYGTYLHVYSVRLDPRPNRPLRAQKRQTKCLFSFTRKIVKILCPLPWYCVGIYPTQSALDVLLITSDEQ